MNNPPNCIIPMKKMPDRNNTNKYLKANYMYNK